MYCRAITSSDAIHWAPKWLIVSSSLKWPKLLLRWLQREGTAGRGGSAPGTRTTRERREEGRRGRLCEDGGWREKGGRCSDHQGIENSTVFLARGKVSTRCWKLKKKKKNSSCWSINIALFIHVILWCCEIVFGKSKCHFCRILFHYERRLRPQKETLFIELLWWSQNFNKTRNFKIKNKWNK